MSKKVSSILIALLILSIFVFSPITAMADPEDEKTNDFVLLKDGDTGDYVLQVQLRLKDLGYFNYKITNYYGPYTTEVVRAFQAVNGLPADGVLGPETAEVLFADAAKRRPVEEIKKIEPKVSGPSVSKGKLKDWFSYVYPRLDRGDKIKVTDVETGISFYMVRTGGSNHADVEPVSSSDTKNILKAYGGEWSWERRAIVVRLDGVNIAASMNGFPHAYDLISGNGMDGHVCIHFLNSKTHIRDAVDPAHQAMVYAAAGK